MGGISRLPSINRSSTGGPRRSTVRIIDVTVAARSRRCSCARGLMAMSAAILSIVVAPIGCQTTWMRLSWRRSNQGRDQKERRQHPRNKQHSRFNPQCGRRLNFLVMPVLHLQRCPSTKLPLYALNDRIEKFLSPRGNAGGSSRGARLDEDYLLPHAKFFNFRLRKNASLSTRPTISGSSQPYPRFR